MTSKKFVDDEYRGFGYAMTQYFIRHRPISELRSEMNSIPDRPLTDFEMGIASAIDVLINVENLKEEG